MYEVEKRPNQFYVKDTEGNYVGEVFFQEGDANSEREAKERALLFSAASDMLEALKGVYNIAYDNEDNFCPIENKEYDEWKKVRLAIEKAKEV